MLFPSAKIEPMKNLLLAATILLVLLGTSCSGLLTPDAVRVYYYRATADDQVPLLEGRITLELIGSSKISGEWRIGWIDGVDQGGGVGPQLGRGALRGDLQDGRFYFDLNPQMADNNVLLAGDWGDGDLSGTWGWVGIGGIILQGGFTLERLDPFR